MNVLIIGCSLLGCKSARVLEAMDWGVSVLDSDERALQRLEEGFDGALFHGYPMNLQDLRKAGIESCDAVIVATGDDNLNITAAQIAKDFFNIKNVIASVSDPERESVFEHFGLHTVCPTNLTAHRMITLLTGGEELQRLSVGSHVISFISRPVEKSQTRRTLWELRGSAGEEIFGLIRKDGTLLLRAADAPQPEMGDSILYAKVID